jgi:hypothetical protein
LFAGIDVFRLKEFIFLFFLCFLSHNLMFLCCVFVNFPLFVRVFLCDVAKKPYRIRVFLCLVVCLVVWFGVVLCFGGFWWVANLGSDLRFCVCV